MNLSLVHEFTLSCIKSVEVSCLFSSSGYMGFSVINLFPMRILKLSWLFLILFLTNFDGINVVLVSGQCQSDQQSLLLQMKSSLKFNSSLSTRVVQWNQSSDCCDWSGVVCDEAGRVIGLDLSTESISGGIDNASALQYLQSLNLAFNSFNGAQIPTSLASFTKLTYLNLSESGFVGQIPIEISSMTSLVTLDLSSQRLSAFYCLRLEIPNLSLFLQNLTELRNLYLDSVNISALGQEWCQALSVLPNLQVLSLSSCSLSGPIHSSLAKLGSLSVINLSDNNLSSPVPEFLADFSNLTALYLSSCSLYGKFPEKIFQVTTLETLDLSYNQLLQGSLPDIPLNLSLRTLILSSTNFSMTLPDSIGNLKSMSRLEIAFCNFTGPIPSSMALLTQLVYLDFSYNRLSGSIPSLHMSRNLAYLDFSHNLFAGGISSTGWEQLLNLFYVDLRYNSFTESIPRSLFELPMLQQLQLANNQFDSQVPEFSNASSSVLGIVDLSDNNLEGPIPLSVFELKKLNALILSSNKLNGTVELGKIERLSDLTTLDLSYNRLTVNASSNSSFFPQIRLLRLASCKLTTIPKLKNQSTLQHLDLSENQISGEIPNWIWEVGNGGLIHLNLSHNHLVSLQQPFSISNLSYMTVVDLHSNQIQGKIPQLPQNAAYLDYSNNNFTSSIAADIGNFMQLSIFFSLSNNALKGTIPESMCNATNLLVLDLSNNYLSGIIPTCIIKMSDHLGVLNLRRNNLNGIFSVIFPKNCRLQSLDLNGNQLEGIVPKSLANCNMLEILDVGNNNFYDTFPCWLQNASRLHVLILRSNNFFGNINCPRNNVSLPMLQIIDLASNKFSGTLPQKWLLKLEAMMLDEAKSKPELKQVEQLGFQFLRLSRLYYHNGITVTSKGLEMKLVKILTIFISIDFSNNMFEGSIPEEIGLFKSLIGLNLSHNALTGSIPLSFGKLKEIESLDLSTNNLSGPIPAQLASLNFLSYLNLSCNHLVGKIPTGTQLQSFYHSYDGNEGLWGPPLMNDCLSNSNNVPSPAPASSSKEIDWFFIIMAIGFAIGFGAGVTPLMFSWKVNGWYDDLINRFLNRLFRVCNNLYHL